MRIIGGRDYYDSALSHGRDEKVMMIRYTEKSPKTVPLYLAPKLHIGVEKDVVCYIHDPYNEKKQFQHGIDTIQFPRRDIRSRRDVLIGENSKVSLAIKLVTVVFAGVKHKGVRTVPISVFPGHEDLDKTYWSIQEFHKTFPKHHFRYSYWEDRKTKDEPDIFGSNLISKEEMEYVLDEQISIAFNERSIHDRMFTGGSLFKNERTLVKDEKAVWMINPDCLGKYNFFNVVGPYEAFQILSGWVSGVLPGMSPKMEIISDKVKLEKHGFDSKWSFRKHRDDPKINKVKK